MDTTFLSYLLLLSLILILILYLHQISKNTRMNNKNTKNQLHENNEKSLFTMYNNKLTLEDHNNKYKDRIHKKLCMPIHPVGPVHNFHQHFNKYKNIPISSLPTGIPEMGWRNLYLANYSQNQVVEEDPFSGTPIRNFLNNLDNVKNIYREEC